MAEPNPETGVAPPEPSRFPFVTVAATLATLFLFLGLMLVAYRSPNGLDEPKSEATDAKGEPKLDAAAKLDEVKKLNENALKGSGAKMPLWKAHESLISKLKGPKDELPFPTPEPPLKDATKKDEKKDDKGKNP